MPRDAIRRADFARLSCGCASLAGADGSAGHNRRRGGIAIGQVTNIASYNRRKARLGEIGITLAFGARLVFIPNDVAVINEERVVLIIPPRADFCGP